jgi:hypothetical protein
VSYKPADEHGFVTQECGPRGTASEIFGYHDWNMNTQEKVIGETAAGPFAKGGNMMWKIVKTLSFILASSVLPAVAQNSAEITGSASDTSGAVIVGVTVTITNTATNQARKVNTNAAGAYNVPYLAPGVYDVTAESAGFKVTARKA